MADPSPTPWERAKADSDTFQGVSPRLVSALVAAVIAVAAQALLGWPGGKVTPYAITLGSALLAAVFLSVGELVVHWWRAPSMMLLDEVVALRGVFREGSGQKPASTGYVPPRPPDLRLALLDAIRRGKELSGNGVSPNAVEHWTSGVFDLLTHYGTPEEAEQFITAPRYLTGRIKALERITEARDGT